MWNYQHIRAAFRTLCNSQQFVGAFQTVFRLIFDTVFLPHKDMSAFVTLNFSECIPHNNLHSNCLYCLQKLVQLRIDVLPLADLRVVDDVPLGNDHLKVSQDTQIVQWIFCGDYHVCIFALLD